ncbi:AAA family ATPase [Pseudooceanicola sp. 200-1SW]|uniref:AAA family ATPase n=1 Tax=Pseudooceanicola sp. 200-1SW TaxID=3425949 RepID=UPI003D7FC5BA
MIVLLNGYPGIGKLTIGRHLAARSNAVLLDLHTLYNPAYALAAPKSQAYFNIIREIWAVVDPRVLALPPGQRVILTDVMAGRPPHEPWIEENLARLHRLGAARGGLAVVNLSCARAENRRRITAPERAGAGKPRDPAYADAKHTAAKPLLSCGADHLLELDVTELSAEAAALRIAAWLDAPERAVRGSS